MQFEFSDKPLQSISTDGIVVFALQKKDGKKSSYLPLASFRELDSLTKGELSRVCNLESFDGKRGSVVTYYPQNMLASRIVVVGLGSKDAFVAHDLRRAMGKLAGMFHYAVDSIALSLPEDKALGMDLFLAAQVVGEGLELGVYEYGKYKEQEKKDHVFQTVIIAESDKARQIIIKEAIRKAKLYTEATRVARDLVNEQSAVATPTYLAQFAKDIAKSSPQITCKIIEREEAEKLGMHAFLGIAQGADTPPKFIHLTYTPKKPSERKLAIVGKGITFDSGGINVKPGDHMKEMKMDMAGAAVVLGVFSVLSSLRPDFSIIGLIAATPNMISGKSIVPGDVVTAMNGKTIEILNTDAEGRVTLADSLSYAVKEKATEIVDFATLTGACVVALGEDIAGLFPNNQDLAAKIKAAAYDAGEKVWEMPMDADMREQNKSDIADIANIPSSRYAGAITAGLFLEAFVNDVPFVHMDIAGPAFSHKKTELSDKGGTGFGVRTMLEYITGKEVK